MNPRLALCLILFLLPAGAGLADELLYKSNGFGMLLERIAPYRRDESEWIMAIASTGPEEVRRLLEKGREVRRWEFTPAGGGMRVERERAGTVLAARRVYDAVGYLIQEERYTDGELTQKIVSTFTSGRLVRSRTLDAEGALLSTDEYVYATNGSLREVRRTEAAGSAEKTSFVAGSSGLSEERVLMGDTLIVSRYDSRGRLINAEKRVGGVSVSREDFSFRPDSDLLASSMERQPVEGTIIARLYDEGGLISTETTTTKSGAVRVVVWLRDDKGRVIGKVSRSSAGLEQWKYFLADDGTVTREEYSRRGSLEKVTLHGESKQRTEEFYQDGELFLKAMYDGDTRAKEEVWSGGELVRSRSYP